MKLNNIFKAQYIFYFTGLVLIVSGFLFSSKMYWPRTQPIQAQTTKEIPLTVAENQGINRVRESVTSGVPFKPREIFDENTIRLLDNQRKEIPAQVRVLTRWYGSPEDTSKSIKWLLVDFQSDVNANAQAAYFLEYGSNVRRTANASDSLAVKDLGSEYQITTGKNTFKLNKQTFNLFNSVDVGGNEFITASSENGGQINGIKTYVSAPRKDNANTGSVLLQSVKVNPNASTENWTLEFTGSTVYDTLFKVTGSKTGADGEGRRNQSFISTSGKIEIPTNFWRLFPKKGDKLYFSTIAENDNTVSNIITSIALEESGPLRSVFKIKGNFANTSSQSIDFTARLHLYAGKSYSKLFFTIENNNYCYFASNVECMNIGTQNTIYFDEANLNLNLNLEPAKNYQLGVDSSVASGALGQAIELYQDSSGNDKWNLYQDPKYNPRSNSYVSFRGYKVYKDSTESESGNHAPGWLDISDSKKGVAIGVRDFWQNYPKGLEADANGVRINLFPDKYSTNIAMRSGEHKTHEVLYYFHEGNGASAGAENIFKSFNNPLFAAAMPQYYADSKAFHDISPEDTANYPIYEKGNKVNIDPVSSKKNLFTQIDALEFYGWQDYGDVPIDYECTRGQFNLKYNFDWGMFLQFARTGDARWFDLGVKGNKHLVDIDTLHQPYLPFDTLNYWYKGGVFVHSNHDECGDKNPNRNYNRIISQSYAGAYGSAARYFFTGDESAREATLEMADNAILIMRFTRGAERDFYSSLIKLFKGYELTGEQKYLDTISLLLDKAKVDKARPTPGMHTWNIFLIADTAGRYLDLLEKPDEKAKAVLLQKADLMMKMYIPPSGSVPGHMNSIIVSEENEQFSEEMFDNWLLSAADGFAYAYKYSGNKKYLDTAREIFKTAQYPIGYKSPVTYWWTKEATNQANWGPIFMYYDKKEKEQPPIFNSADLNQDGKVDNLDFDILRQNWNQTTELSADINQDGITDSKDLGILMGKWTR